MTHDLDDLLRDLPSEAMSSDLPLLIQRRLSRERSRGRQMRGALDAGLALLVICGAIVLAPQVNALASLPIAGAPEASLGWVDRLASAPAPVIWDTLAGGIEWTRGLAERFGFVGMLGLVLLAIPLFAWLRRLLPEAAAAGSPVDLTSPMVEGGVGA